jgi:hypothetical protein
MPKTTTPTKNQMQKPITIRILKEVKAETNGFITRGFKLWAGMYSTPEGRLREVYYVDTCKRGRLQDRLCFGCDKQAAEAEYYELIAEC